MCLLYHLVEFAVVLKAVVYLGELKPTAKAAYRRLGEYDVDLGYRFPQNGLKRTNQKNPGLIS